MYAVTVKDQDGRKKVIIEDECKQPFSSATAAAAYAARMAELWPDYEYDWMPIMPSTLPPAPPN